MSYRIENACIIFEKTQKLVARIVDGHVKFEKGLAASHGARFKAWATENGLSFGVPSAPAIERAHVPDAPPPLPEPPAKTLALTVEVDYSTVPFSTLPYYDPRLGAKTPEVERFISDRNLKQNQQRDLMLRLQKGR